MASERSGGNKGQGDRAALRNPDRGRSPEGSQWEIKGKRSGQPRSSGSHEVVISEPSGRRPSLKRSLADDSLESEVLRLRKRVEHLETLVQSLLPTPPIPASRPIAAADAHYRWIEQHPEMMRNHPDCFVAIDPTLGDNGLVVHDEDEAAFARQLLKLYETDPTARERLLLTHTSAY
jgi:hypothetical protein